MRRAFYDLKRSKVVCPKCEAPFTVEAKPKVKRAIATPPKAAPPLAPLKELAEKSGDTEMSAEDKVLKEFTADILTDNNLAADDDDDEDENSFEDASELGKDEDDMAEVIDGGRKVDES